MSDLPISDLAGCGADHEPKRFQRGERPMANPVKAGELSRPRLKRRLKKRYGPRPIEMPVSIGCSATELQRQPPLSAF